MAISKIVVGVTGRAGSGKTTFARFLATEVETYFAAKTTQDSNKDITIRNRSEKPGSPIGCEANARGQVIEADPVAWELYSRSDIRDRLTRMFGDVIFSSHGKLDRRKLGDIVFADKSKLAALNSIIHPPLLAELDCRIEQSQARVVILDAALLLDWPIAERCAMKIAVLARKSISLERLSGKGLSTERALAVLSNQRSGAEFRRLCDVVIINEGSEDELARKAATLWKNKITPLLS